MRSVAFFCSTPTADRLTSSVGDFETGVLTGEKMDLFAASPIVPREVMGLLAIGLAPGRVGVSGDASRLAGG